MLGLTYQGRVLELWLNDLIYHFLKAQSFGTIGNSTICLFLKIKSYWILIWFILYHTRYFSAVTSHKLLFG